MRSGTRSAWGFGVLVATLAAGFVGLGPGAQAAPGRPAEASTGCVDVASGAPVGGGGPSRATVVVDTGTGAVWSACISFRGEISGVEALERADAVIADLDPVYDQYVGLGRAVCRLRGVGSDPPDCLGKSPSYWSYSHNGRVASVGAGAVTVRDGDVQGWRYGSGGTPRSATVGSRATSAAPATTTTTRPPATTTAVPATTVPAPGGGGLVGRPGGPTTTVPAGAVPTSAPAVDPEAGEDPASATTQPGDADPTSTTVASPPEESADAEAPAGDGDAAVAAPGSSSGGSSGASGSGTAGGGASGASSSGAGSALGFAAALALVGGAAVLVRRRRLTTTGGGPAAISS